MKNEQQWCVTKDWLKSEKQYLKKKEIEIEKEGLTIKQKLEKMQHQ